MIDFHAHQKLRLPVEQARPRKIERRLFRLSGNRLWLLRFFCWLFTRLLARLFRWFFFCRFHRRFFGGFLRGAETFQPVSVARLVDLRFVRPQQAKPKTRLK